MKIINVLILVGIAGFFGWIVTRLSEAAVHQHVAESFPQVPGIVESSQVTTTHTSKGGTHYHVHISYRYSVGGVNYIGYRYRYDGHPTGAAATTAIVNSHHPGSAVNVYYNPQNPKDTVLSIGVDDKDVALPFFMGGMLLFMLGAFSRPTGFLFQGSNAVAGGLKIISEMMTTRVRLPRYEPITLALWVAAGLSGLGALLVGTDVLRPPWSAGEWCLLIVLMGTATMYLVHWLKLNSGSQDLVIDEPGHTLQLPLTYKRRERKQVSFSEVRSVLLKKVRHSSRSGGYYTYLVMLELKDDRQEKLVDLKLERARTFASWLKDKLGLTGPAMEIGIRDES